MPDAVFNAAHDALPRSWQRRKEPSGWPLVAGALIIAAVVAGVVWMLPTLRLSKRPVEHEADAQSEVDDRGISGDPLAHPDAVLQFEEQRNGEKVAF